MFGHPLVCITWKFFNLPWLLAHVVSLVDQYPSKSGTYMNSIINFLLRNLKEPIESCMDSFSYDRVCMCKGGMDQSPCFISMTNSIVHAWN